MALLVVLAAAFAYLSHSFLRIPPAIGLMVLGLVTSLAQLGLAQLGVALILTLAHVVGTPSTLAS